MLPLRQRDHHAPQIIVHELLEAGLRRNLTALERVIERERGSHLGAGHDLEIDQVVVDIERVRDAIVRHVGHVDPIVLDLVEDRRVRCQFIGGRRVLAVDDRRVLRAAGEVVPFEHRVVTADRAARDDGYDEGEQPDDAEPEWFFH